MIIIHEKFLSPNKPISQQSFGYKEVADDI